MVASTTNKAGGNKSSLAVCNADKFNKNFNFDWFNRKCYFLALFTFWKSFYLEKNFCKMHLKMCIRAFYVYIFN